jgi:hypothetical protein
VFVSPPDPMADGVESDSDADSAGESLRHPPSEPTVPALTTVR